LIDTTHANIQTWRRVNPADLYRNNAKQYPMNTYYQNYINAIDNLTAATLEKYTNDYLKEVEG